MKGRSRGFSLIELILAMAILSSLVIAGVASLRGAQVKNQSKAAAEILAEGFRLANLRARSQGFPVGVGLPSDIGKTPVARGFYNVAGEFGAPHTPGYDFGAELPDAIVFSGTYAGPTWTPPLATLSRGSQFDFEDWQPPYPSDAYVVFLPTGEVVANHSAANGQYRVVVGTRCSYNEPVPVSQPTLPPEATLTGISDPYTITISTQGQVEVVPGLLEGDPQLVRSYRQLGRTERVAAAPSQYRGPNRPPELIAPKVIIDPPPDRKVIPVLTSVDAAIALAPSGQVSLTFFARDPDGDQLTCVWESTPPGGRWTLPSTRMRWSYERSAWYRTAIWKPPANALPNTRFRLYCHIQDGRGKEIVPSASTTLGYPGATADGIDVTILPTLRLAYKDAGGGLSASTFDGSGSTSILSSSKLKAGTPSRMAWARGQHGLLYQNGAKPRFLGSLDGEDPQSVGNDTAFGGTLNGLATQGTRLYGLVEAGSAQKIQSLPAPPVGGDLTPKNEITLPGGTGPLEGLISSDAQQTLVTTDGAGKYVFVFVKDDVTCSVVAGPSLKNLMLSPDSKQLYGLAADGSIQSCPLTLDGDTGSASLGTATPVLGPGCSLPSLSPDGTFMVYQDTAGKAQLYNLTNATAVELNVSGYSDMVWSEE
jgi:prepilin-type N-terminal cleavage/methylation domain-containing protein